jgi:hypothetical protein
MILIYIFYMKKVIITVLLSILFCHNIFTQDNNIGYTVRDLNYLIKIHNIQTNENIEFILLEKYNFIAGPSYGYSGTYSDQWIIYKEIINKYSNEIIEKEYYRTNSIVLKIYLYWILREQNWRNIKNIYIDLLKYNDIKINFAPGGCIVLVDFPIKDIIDYEYKEYQGENYDIIYPEIYFENNNITLNPLLD